MTLSKLRVHGESEIGWDAAVEPNEHVDECGFRVDRDADYGEPDPTCPSMREFDDPEVIKLREYLRANNGIKNLEIVEPHEVKRAADVFHRDGFVVVKDLLSAELLAAMRHTCARYLEEILSIPGREGQRYMQESGRLPHRYCYGTSSCSRQMMHDETWVRMIDMPTSTPILTEIFGTDDYLVWGGGGDLSLPGAIEYQHLHTDGVDAQQNVEERLNAARRLDLGVELQGPFAALPFRSQRLVMDFASPGVTINFLMSDLTFENGPIRQIPGTHTASRQPPTPAEEPEWMRLSTLVGAPAGAGVLRDTRAWHGATPNLSREIRALPSIEYSAGWSKGRNFQKSMPHEIWETLSAHAQKITLPIKQEPGIWPYGAGKMHPLAGVRRDTFAKEAGEDGESNTVRTDPRSAGTAVRVFSTSY